MIVVVEIEEVEYLAVCEASCEGVCDLYGDRVVGSMFAYLVDLDCCEVCCLLGLGFRGGGTLAYVVCIGVEDLDVTVELEGVYLDRCEVLRGVLFGGVRYVDAQIDVSHDDVGVVRSLCYMAEYFGKEVREVIGEVCRGDVFDTLWGRLLYGGMGMGGGCMGVLSVGDSCVELWGCGGWHRARRWERRDIFRNSIKVLTLGGILESLVTNLTTIRERSSELEDGDRVGVVFYELEEWDRVCMRGSVDTVVVREVIGVNRYNLLLLLKDNAARHNLLLLLKVNAAKHNLLLLLKVNATKHKLTTDVENDDDELFMIVDIAQGSKLGACLRACCLFIMNPNKIAQNEEAGIQLQAEEFDFMAVAADLDEIEEVNANCILMANLQQASTSGTQTDKAPVYDSDGSAEVQPYANCYNNEIFNMFTQEEEYTELLEPIPEPHQVQQNNSNVIFKEEKKKLKSDFKIREDDLLDKQIQLKNKLKELDNILVKTGQSIQTMHMLLPKPDSFYQTEQKMALGYQNLFYLKQTQQKQQSLYNGKVLLEKHDPPAVYNSEETLELAQEKAAKFVQDFKSLAKEADESIAKHKALELEIDHLLRAVVSQDIMSIVQNNSVVDTSNLQTELKHKALYIDHASKWIRTIASSVIPQKVNKMHDLSNPVTSNSVPTTEESKVVDNNKVIAPGMFRINPFKNHRVEKFVPNKPSKASVRTNPITASQPHVIIKKAINSDSNGFSSTGVDITTKTRRPQPRSNTKNDRVPSASKSSRIMNKEVDVEDHPRNLLLSTNKKPLSSECNNIKLAIQNDKSEIVCAMCKQCLITANHDVCVLNYVNGMNSHSMKRKANVSKIANQTTHKAQVWKPKNVGSKERLASPKPSQTRLRLRWSPTGNMFGGIKGIIIDLRYPNMFMVPRLRLFQAYDRESKAPHQLCLEVLGHRSSRGRFYEETNVSIRNLKPMARATSTKSWLWHQRLSHLNFDTINDLARNDLVTGLQVQIHKEHLCPSCEQRKKQKGFTPTQTCSKFKAEVTPSSYGFV
ncbi:integrase, catalytic region, zinc finger, CCHC-type containing protein [Tanacetum coccineum]|uniref:Integrase, catalytic region, zinc finger, CCHC-type containing protein n=1 Tax=Tanacetum coccineum TaxID=301880 RepID=A0ABQ5CUM0_9ASTR